MTPLLRAINIKKSFYAPQEISILTGVNLEVYPGNTIAITGKSGQGKSTLLQILGTLEPPCSGTVEIGGQKVGSFTKNFIRNQSIAFIFQSFHLLEDYTALENVLMPAKIGRQSTRKGSTAYERALYLLEKVGLTPRAGHHTKFLSGGEKQRVAIARALCNDPDILFADEPSGNLDKETSEMIHSLLIDFATNHSGKALVVVTHNPDLAAMCQSEYNIFEGAIQLIKKCVPSVRFKGEVAENIPTSNMKLE